MLSRISSYEDIIDSRDVIARIEELDELEDPSEDEVAELNSLRELENEAKGYAPDWEFGVVLVRDSYFQEYAKQLAEDIGAISGDATWPNNCIDWEQAAEELQVDYTSVEYDGVTYWVR